MQTDSFKTAQWFFDRGAMVYPILRDGTCVKGVREQIREKTTTPEILQKEFIAAYKQIPQSWVIFADGWFVVLDAEDDKVLERLKKEFPKARIERGSKGGHLFFKLKDRPVERIVRFKSSDGRYPLEMLVNWACTLSGSEHRAKDLRYTTIKEGEIIDINYQELKSVLTSICEDFKLTWEVGEKRGQTATKELITSLPKNLQDKIRMGVKAGGGRNNERFKLALELILAGVNRQELEALLLAFNANCAEPEERLAKVILHARSIWTGVEMGAVTLPEEKSAKPPTRTKSSRNDILRRNERARALLDIVGGKK